MAKLKVKRKEPDYTITEAAKSIGVSRVTIYTWIDNKKIEAYQLPSGKWRIKPEEIEKIKNR